MIDIKGWVIVQISQDLISIEVNEDCIFLYFEPVNFEKSNTVFLRVLNFLFLHLYRRNQIMLIK